MKKSEYLRQIEYADNPYAGWISIHGKECFVSSEDQTLDVIRWQIDSQGYIIFVKENGVVDNHFYSHLLDLIEKEHPDCVYCDEDVCDEGVVNNRSPFFKPDFSPDTLESFFYMGGLVAIKRELYPGDTDDIERSMSKADMEGIRDCLLDEFFCNKITVCHVSEVLYHSYEDTPREIYSYNIPYKNKITPCEQKLVSAIILSKDNPKLIKDCISSLKEQSDMDMEYIVVDNGSTPSNRKIYESELGSYGVSYYYHPMDFIYSALCNYGAKQSKGDFLLFLNDDVILPKETEGFPSLLMKQAAKNHVGAVGVKLLYPKHEGEPDRIQHIGMTQLCMGPSHRLATYRDDICYDRGRNRGVWNVMGVTGACLLVSRDKFTSVNGFDERIEVAYTDTDLCLDLYEKGYLNVCINDIHLIHYESITRGSDGISEEKLSRLRRERELLYSKHPWLLNKGDVFDSDNLSKSSLGYLADYTLPWDEIKMCSMDVQSYDYIPGKDAVLLGAIDRCSYVGKTTDDTEPYYEIEGWAILHGKNQLNVRPTFVIKSADGAINSYNCVRKYRKELSAVFPKEKNQCMSGFVCRIPRHELDLSNVAYGFGAIPEGIFGKNKCYYRLLEIDI